MTDQIYFEIILPEKRILFHGSKVELDVENGHEEFELKETSRFIAVIKPYLQKLKDFANKLKDKFSNYYVRAVYITGLDEFPMPFYLPLTSVDKSEEIQKLIGEANASVNSLFDELLRTIDSVYNSKEGTSQQTEETNVLPSDEIVEIAVRKIKSFPNDTVFSVSEVLESFGANLKDTKKMFKYYEMIYSQISNIIKPAQEYIGATVGLPFNIFWRIVKKEK